MNILKIIDEACKDSVTGQYSHARVIALFVALAATLFMWKLIILGGMTIEYFMAYLAYGAGSQTLNKFLDNSDTARAEQARTVNSTPIENQKDNPVPPAPVPPAGPLINIITPPADK